MTQQKGEEALSNAGRLLRSYADASLDAIYVKDRQSRWLFANPALERITGKTSPELLGKTDVEIYSNLEIGKAILANDWKVMESGKPETFEEFVDLPDGRHYFISVKSPRFDVKGNVNGLLGISHDITNRKRREEHLRESQEKYKALIETTSDFVWEVDPYGRYTYCSPQMERLWGIKPSEMIGKTPFDQMPPETRAKGLEAFKESTFSQQPFSGLQIPSLDVHGNLVYLEISGVPFFDSNGKLLGFRGITRDITERKKAEDRVRQLLENVQLERDKLSSLINSMSDEVWFADKEGKFTLANPSALKQFNLNLSNQEIDVDSFVKSLEIFHVDGTPRSPVEAQPLRSLKGEVIKDEEEIVKNPENGELRYRQVNSAPVRDAEGNIIGSVSVVRDITDRKKAEESLRESRERMDFALQASHLGAWDLDLIDHTAFRSLEHDMIFGYKELLPQWTYETFLEHVIPEDRDMVDSKFKQAIESKSDWNFECRIRRNDGAIRWIWASGNHRFDESGTARRMAGVVQDITARKKVEEDLKASEEQFRRAIEDAPIPVIMHAEDGQVLQISRTWTKLTGYSLSDIPTFDSWITKAAYGEGANSVRDYMHELFKDENQSIGVEFPVRTVDGTVRYWSFSASSPGTLRDGRRFIVGMAVDITERQKAEDALRKSEWVNRSRAEELERMQVKLEEKAAEVEEYANQMENLAEERALKLKDAERLAAIGATAGMVGHDIRNPLQAISGDLYLILNDLANLPDSEQKRSILESLKGIDESVSYVNKIVQDLQDFARPLKPVAEKVDLENLVREVLFKNGVPERIEATCHIQKQAKAAVTDRELLKRILVNLMNNAVQAMPKSGKLEIQAFLKVGNLVITIKDTGAGIPEDIRPKLFTPLFTTKSRGQGFGLAVVKRLTEALGGTVTFESKVDKGTKFILNFPHAELPTAAF